MKLLSLSWKRGFLLRELFAVYSDSSLQLFFRFSYPSGMKSDQSGIGTKLYQ